MHNSIQIIFLFGRFYFSSAANHSKLLPATYAEGKAHPKRWKGGGGAPNDKHRLSRNLHMLIFVWYLFII